MSQQNKKVNYTWPDKDFNIVCLLEGRNEVKGIHGMFFSCLSESCLYTWFHGLVQDIFSLSWGIIFSRKYDYMPSCMCKTCWLISDFYPTQRYYMPPPTCTQYAMCFPAKRPSLFCLLHMHIYTLPISEWKGKKHKQLLFKLASRCRSSGTSFIRLHKRAKIKRGWLLQ